MPASVVNVSRTGALICAANQLRLGSDWPLLLELNETPLQLTGRVVRLEPAAVTLTHSTLRKQVGIGLTFVEPSSEAQRVLKEMCGNRRELLGMPLGLCHVSFARVCPRCGSRYISRQQRPRYACDACQRTFMGFRIGPFRIAL